MGGTVASPIKAASRGSEENVQLRHNELMSFMEQNKTLRQKNDQLEADNKKLRQEVEILKGSHQIQVDIMNNALIYLSEQFRKDEPTKKKEMSDAEVQTEDFGHLEDGCTVDTTIESATQKIAIITEPLEVQLEAKKALQNGYDRLNADQRKFLEAIAKQILDVQKKQEARTCGCFKPLLVGFMVTLIMVFIAFIAFIASLFAISVDSTDPNALYDRHQYI